MSRMGVAGLAVLLLVGCAAPVTAVPRSNAWPGPSPIPTPDDEATHPQISPEPEPEPTPAFVAQPRSPDDLTEIDCGNEPLAGGFTLVDAALGSRVMRLAVLNCADEAIELGVPAMHGVDSSLVEHDMTVDATAGGMLSPDQHVSLELTWAGNGRCERGIQRLTVALGGQEFSVEDCLQLGGEYAPERDEDIRTRWMEH